MEKIRLLALSAILISSLGITASVDVGTVSGQQDPCTSTGTLVLSGTPFSICATSLNPGLITSCGEITRAGTYVLANLLSFSGICITVFGSSTVSSSAMPGDPGVSSTNPATVDLHGYSMNCPGSCFPSDGVLNFLANGLTITNSCGLGVGPGCTGAGGTISGFTNGIDLLGPLPCNSPPISGSTVSQVVITSNGAHGIHVGCSPNNMIIGNTITNNGGDGIFIDASRFTVIQSNTITGQTTGGSTLGGGAGIEIHADGCCSTIGGSTGGLGNIITGNTNGIYMDGFSGGALIEHNTVDSNTHFGLVTNSGGSTISLNSFSSNGADGIQVAGSSNTITGNTLNSNARRGMVIGNTCAGIIFGSGGTGFSSGSGNTIGGIGPAQNTASLNGLMLANVAFPSPYPTADRVDYFVDHSSGNNFVKDIGDGPFFDFNALTFSGPPPGGPTPHLGAVNLFDGSDSGIATPSAIQTC